MKRTGTDTENADFADAGLSSIGNSNGVSFAETESNRNSGLASIGSSNGVSLAETESNRNSFYDVLMMYSRAIPQLL